LGEQKKKRGVRDAEGRGGVGDERVLDMASGTCPIGASEEGIPGEQRKEAFESFLGKKEYKGSRFLKRLKGSLALFGGSSAESSIRSGVEGRMGESEPSERGGRK